MTVPISNFSVTGLTVDVDGVTTNVEDFKVFSGDKELVAGGGTDTTESLYPTGYSPTIAVEDQGTNPVCSHYPMAGGPRAQSLWYLRLLYHAENPTEWDIDDWLIERGLSTGQTHPEDKVLDLMAHECRRFNVKFRVANGPIS